jgi:hypothetical protein
MRRAPRPQRALTTLVPLAGLLVLLALLSAPAADARARKTVHLRGTAYTFDNQRPIAGATIRIAELPRRKAISGPDGGYDLRVPDGTRITPYADAPGHHRIHVQTFVTAGRDLERVNFQIPTEGIYRALAALLGVPLGADGQLRRCAIVSTFANVAVRELSFADFVAFGAHGVAGATATTTPALPAPVYFNESVIPDRSRTASSIDGGVIWPEVPSGRYLVEGRHPTERFAPFRATCRPGRIVNANPPQGLYQLRPGERLDEDVRAGISERAHRTARGRRVVSVRVRPREYVSLRVELRRRGRLVAATATPRVGAYSPRVRTVRLAVPRGVPLPDLEIRVIVQDAAGNRDVGGSVGEPFDPRPVR